MKESISPASPNRKLGLMQEVPVCGCRVGRTRNELASAFVFFTGKAFFQGAYTTVRLEFLTFQYTGFGLAERAWHMERFPGGKIVCAGKSRAFCTKRQTDKNSAYGSPVLSACLPAPDRRGICRSFRLYCKMAVFTFVSVEKYGAL
ncbi:uncharacterized protein BN578_00367 [[Clostridium] leptum CAG:27]|uniref:Uncharacterized protein n=1 Tax=[Clostridium] leptum CAG:27 TaxID=1263068 RepID=R6P4E0_9FIRM|nr:uncharacterized protein BN578_00367 [[Clostridium] leptum CAG:27]